jgi:hypothetical protein
VPEGAGSGELAGTLIDRFAHAVEHSDLWRLVAVRTRGGGGGGGGGELVTTMLMAESCRAAFIVRSGWRVDGGRWL